MLVTEGSSSSVFAVIGETLYLLTGPGFYLGLHEAQWLVSSPARIKVFFLSRDFLKANEVLTSTSFNVLPVKQITNSFPENFCITFSYRMVGKIKNSLIVIMFKI